VAKIKKKLSLSMATAGTLTTILLILGNNFKIGYPCPSE
jgi:hypothetical protein